MADIIRLLPDSVANQIAAGEVIQRPASVIKELVENAVDAGATNIKVIVKDAGKTLIQVIDNGIGMSDTDARMAFERHATSKIKGADDLFSLHTMGFRGEALPSICAISEVEVKTRTKENNIGTRLNITASKVDSQEPCVCEPGTVISVKKLFFNVPARRKFLKSDTVELANIMREFERLALVNHNIRLSLDTGSKVIDLKAATFRQRIGDLWKNNIDAHLLPVEVDTSIVKIEGFISRPEFARRRNALQYLIVNGRNMQHPYFRKAILSCFDNLIAPDTQPCFFMKFTVSPETIDVNIHPTKNEIKFENEQLIWPILVSSVKTALGKFGAVPSIDFSSEAIQFQPLREGDRPEKPSLDSASGYNPFAGEETVTRNPGNGRRFRATERSRENNNWETLYDSFMSRGESGEITMNPGDTSISGSENIEDNRKIQENFPNHSDFNNKQSVSGNLIENTQVSSVPICIQHDLKYIVTTSREGLLIIDQHRAHVRILYEKYIKLTRRSELVAQSIMFPDVIELDESQQIALGGMEKELSCIGFTLEHEDGSKWRIMTMPSVLKNVNVKDIIIRILDSGSEESDMYGREGDVSDDILGRMALIMARSAAIKRGRQLTSDEMEHLVGELFSLPNPAFTPTGNPVYCILENNRIEGLLS